MSDPPSTGFAGLRAAFDDASLWLLFSVLGGTGASLLALGMLLRGNQQLTCRVIGGTLLRSAAWGSAVFMLTYSRMSDDIAFLLGLSIFSGMGAASFVDLLLLMVRQRLGISVTFNAPSLPPSPAPPAPTPDKDTP